MTYKVQITDFAWKQLNNIVDYIFYDLKNPGAADKVLTDFQNAVETLKKSAKTFPSCKELELAKHGYYRYHLKKHKYILLYRINGKQVFIDRIYHELQDYRNLES